MHVIYSALRNHRRSSRKNLLEDSSEIQLRYQGYTEACNKRRREIAEIQKHFPNWMPPFKSESPGSESPKAL